MKYGQSLPAGLMPQGPSSTRARMQSTRASSSQMVLVVAPLGWDCGRAGEERLGRPRQIQRRRNRFSLGQTAKRSSNMFIYPPEEKLELEDARQTAPIVANQIDRLVV